jgi:hypothetical protein
MKKIAENRYPNAATLFRFCKEALEIRYEGNVKVIDQDVGAILGYDPADCSHWKKGKKNIRSLSTLKTIADHLSIDERLLIEIASGKIGFDEAIFEYKGYGAFALQGRQAENMKKEFFKDPTRYRNETSTLTFEDLFDVDRAGVTKTVQSILEVGRFEEAPVYIPEVVTMFGQFKTVNDETITEPYTLTHDQETQTTTLRYRGTEMRPFLRFVAAKELYKFLVNTQHSYVNHMRQAPIEILDIRANLFAGILLIPGKMLRREVERVDSAKDIVSQLADTFWVSKALMNQRLRDYMENLT